MLWPKGGWSRAIKYLRLRVKRLPDTPQNICRGISYGVFAAFTPFYGLHFFLAYFMARYMRGNVFSALMATFAGNPFTYIPIGVASLKLGNFLLGTEFDHENRRSFVGKSADAFNDFWRNLVNVFSGQEAQWDGLVRFMNEIFWPYLMGGTILGILAAFAAYMLCFPMVVAYQKRRYAKRD